MHNKWNNLPNPHSVARSLSLFLRLFIYHSRPSTNTCIHSHIHACMYWIYTSAIATMSLQRSKYYHHTYKHTVNTKALLLWQYCCLYRFRKSKSLNAPHSDATALSFWVLMENIFIVLAQCYFWYFGAHNNKFSAHFDQNGCELLAFIIHNNAFAHKQGETKRSKMKRYIHCICRCVCACVYEWLW